MDATPMLHERKLMFKFLVMILAASFFVSGCGKNDSGRAFPVKAGCIVTNEQTVSWQVLTADAPLVIIGSASFTKGDLVNAISNACMSLRANGQNERQIQKTMRQYRMAIVENAIAKFLYEQAFMQEAKERGVKPNEKTLESEWQAVTNICAKEGISAEQFAHRMGHKSVDSLKAALEKNVVLHDLFGIMFSNRLEVADAEVEKLHAGLMERNNASKATNMIYKAEMARFREKIIKENIKFSENEEENTKLVPTNFTVECFSSAPADSFDDEEAFMAQVRYSALNVWSEPVETEDSFSIFYFTKIESKSVGTPALYSGFHVSRPKDLGYEVPDKAKLKTDLRKKRNLEIVTPESERLQKKFGVLFPYGFVWQQMFNDSQSGKKQMNKRSK